MKKKRVVFITNHFQYSDGVARALIGLVNNIDPKKFDITIKPIYKCDRSLQSELREDIKLEKCFGFYFRGFDKIAKFIPTKMLYKKFINKKYDIEVAFQCDLPTILVGNSYNQEAVHVSWMHGYALYPNEYEKCDKVVCVSKYCSDKTKQEMGKKVNVTYKYNIVDDRNIKDLSKESIKFDYESIDHPILVSVGRHSSEKGYIRLVNILSQLYNEGYKFHVFLIGNGPEHDKIKKDIEKLNMQDVITLIGEDKNPHKYTAKSDLFICSSFSEGYSTACTEAAILGIPIITTDVPGGKEIIEDCECGILTKKDDNDLKEGIRYVLQNSQILEEWKKVMIYTSNKFTLNARKKEINYLFEEFYQLSDKKIQEEYYDNNN
ncbi:glycosyltransferase [Clostridium perfringens]|uniref:glycosyltransferase n=1 Tax=Clostridium perfringens TaxID=1502 RepID=UPI001C88AEC1|nr:glycosyltransferase [Clostridium perfringens]MDM0691997.1 glycosyltransferase [Clostridium perfringens]